LQHGPLGADATKVHPRFLHYWLLGPDAQNTMNAQAAGATVPHLNVEDIRDLNVSRMPTDPPPAGVRRSGPRRDRRHREQSRRIDLLEQMAQTIYREWFVRFRYPSHDGAALVDSQVGLIPEGWEVKALGALVHVDKGLSYKGAHLTKAGVPMANLKCFRPGGGFRRDGTKPYSGPFKKKHDIAPGDLIMANTDLTQAGSVIGSPAIVPRRGFETGGIISHHVFAIRCSDRDLIPWLYQVFRDDRCRSFARGVASGTTVLGFRPTDLLSFQLPCPPPELWRPFSALGSDLH